MVERYVGDDGEQRLDDIGGIQPAADADFEDGDFRVTLSKVEEGERGHHLKKTGRVRQLATVDQAACRVVHMEIAAREVIVGDGLQVCRAGCVGHAEMNALVHAHEVWRGIKRGAEAGLVQYAGEGGAGGAFAIGARDEHGFEVQLRVSERVAQRAHVGEIPLAAGRTGLRSEFMAERVQALNRVGVGHT